MNFQDNCSFLQSSKVALLLYFFLRDSSASLRSEQRLQVCEVQSSLEACGQEVLRIGARLSVERKRAIAEQKHLLQSQFYNERACWLSRVANNLFRLVTSDHSAVHWPQCLLDVICSELSGTWTH